MNIDIALFTATEQHLGRYRQHESFNTNPLHIAAKGGRSDLDVGKHDTQSRDNPIDTDLLTDIDMFAEQARQVARQIAFEAAGLYEEVGRQKADGQNKG